MFKPCIIIPVYNHGYLLLQSIDKIQSHKVAIFIIDDGSDNKTKRFLRQIKEQYSDIFLINLGENGGKGKAVCFGLKQAFAKGFTHALQIDADNQHNISDIKIFLKLAKANPNSLINGLPIYDKTVPKSRLYGRKITNFWVKVETCSTQIKDAMCGFRVYPLKKTVKLLKKTKLSNRMGFDIEIIVRLYWQGVKIINQKTKVIYPKDGISHFKMIKDNLAISWLHTKLCCNTPFYLLKKLYKS